MLTCLTSTKGQNQYCNGRRLTIRSVFNSGPPANSSTHGARRGCVLEHSVIRQTYGPHPAVVSQAPLEPQQGQVIVHLYSVIEAV